MVGPRMRGRLVVRVAVGHDEHGEPRGRRGEDQPDEPALEDGLEPLHGPQKNRRGAPAWPVRPVAVDRLDWVVAIAVPSTSEGDGGHPNAGCSDSPWVQGFAPTREHLHSPVLSLLTSRTTSFPRSEHRSNAVPRRQAWEVHFCDVRGVHHRTRIRRPRRCPDRADLAASDPVRGARRPGDGRDRDRGRSGRCRHRLRRARDRRRRPGARPQRLSAHPGDRWERRSSPCSASGHCGRRFASEPAARWRPRCEVRAGRF